MIVEDLTAGGIVHQFVRIADESRSSTIVLDPAGTQVATEVVEYGPIVRPDELEAFASAYGYLLGGSEAVVLAGSLPRDVPEDWYATALREARRQRVFAVLDSEGEPLRLGLARRARPRRAQPDGGRGARRLRVRGRRRISCSRSSRSSRWAPAAS